ncbi:hypothetical protein FGO68_gene1036 [Halteria grandinella]|uniref:Uncharacterized protein n=1 Tax=Halteria grandinella TaxID=5974 RepID=A0A8J8P3V4_HALGN|nr:hypothetical protein FGO68_gene1036 [Halteria grandinella]
MLGIQIFNRLRSKCCTSKDKVTVLRKQVQKYAMPTIPETNEEVKQESIEEIKEEVKEESKERKPRRGKKLTLTSRRKQIPTNNEIAAPQQQQQHQSIFMKEFSIQQTFWQ